MAEADVTGLVADLVTLAGAISGETSRATAAEGTNATAISTEVSRATAAEGVTATAVSTETTRATAAEVANATAISTEATTRAGADTTESAARIAADALKAPLASPAFTTVASVEQDGVGTSPTAGLLLRNTTPAATSAQQNPPYLELDGQYWDGAASQTGVCKLLFGFGSGNPPSVNCTLEMLGASTVNYAFALTNKTPATSGQNCLPPALNLIGRYWDGSVSAGENWRFGVVLGSGANPTSTLSLVHSGSSGTATFDLSQTGLVVKVPTATALTNSTVAASTAYSDAAVAAEATARATADALLAPKANPALTGTATAVTLKASKSITTGLSALGNVSGAALAIDLSLGNVITMTLTGNVTSSSFTNAVTSAGQEVTFIITQDGTGGRTFAWPSAIIPALLGPAPTLAPGSVSVFKGVVDGAGNVNFVGPYIVFRQIVTGITTSDAAHGTLFTPPVRGNYRISAGLFCAVTGAGGATMSINAVGQNGNDISTTSNAIGSTTTVRSTGASIFVYASSTDSNNTMGYKTTLANTIGTATYTAEVIIEWLGE